MGITCWGLRESLHSIHVLGASQNYRPELIVHPVTSRLNASIQEGVSTAAVSVKCTRLDYVSVHYRLD